jgi:hypothetical protein
VNLDMLLFTRLGKVSKGRSEVLERLNWDAELIVLLAFLPYPTEEEFKFTLPHQNDSEEHIGSNFGKLANFLVLDKEGESLSEWF